MWLAIRLEYCTSLCRFSTSAIVVGSAPDGFQRCTAKIREYLRGLSSNTASVGVFDRMPPSQYNSPSIRTAGNAGGSAPDATFPASGRLIGMIEMAIRQAEPTAKSEAVTLDIAARIATPSPRERQVLHGLIAGRTLTLSARDYD